MLRIGTGTIVGRFNTDTEVFTELYHFSGSYRHVMVSPGFLLSRPDTTSSVANLVKLLDNGNYKSISNATQYGKINGVSYEGDKVFINGSVYALTDDLGIGELLEENAYENTDYCIRALNSKYYYYGTSLYEFVDNSFNLIADDYDITNTDTFSVNFDSNFINLYEFTHDNTQIGIKSDQYNYYFKSISSFSQDSSLIKSGNKFFNSAYEIVHGTMPNNGELNYTPSTSQQTIPAGYTSGGTIEAVTNAIDENIVAGNIKKDITILGITGTFEGGGIDFNNTDLEIEDIAKKSEAYSRFINLYPNTSITNMSEIFSNNINIQTTPMIDTTNITNMSNMFSRCINLINIPLYNTVNVTDMSNMFSGCTNLVNIPILDMSNVTNAENMFINCNSLNHRAIENIATMLPNANNLTNQYVESLGINVSNLENNVLVILNNKGYVDAVPTYNPNPNYTITVIT